MPSAGASEDQAGTRLRRPDSRRPRRRWPRRPPAARSGAPPDPTTRDQDGHRPPSRARPAGRRSQADRRRGPNSPILLGPRPGSQPNSAPHQHIQPQAEGDGGVDQEGTGRTRMLPPRSPTSHSTLGEPDPVAHRLRSVAALRQRSVARSVARRADVRAGPPSAAWRHDHTTAHPPRRRPVRPAVGRRRSLDHLGRRAALRTPARSCHVLSCSCCWSQRRCSSWSARGRIGPPPWAQNRAPGGRGQAGPGRALRPR